MVTITRRRRWIVLAIVLGLTLVAAYDVRRPDPPQRVIVEPVARSARHAAEISSQEFASAPMPEVRVEKLRPRAHATPVDSPFEIPVWEQAVDQETRRRFQRTVRAPPQPPPLPYAYLGKLIQDDETLVFLSREDRIYIARSGETLDGLYTAHAIEEDRLVVDYLPLGIRQTLAFEPTGAPTIDSTHAPAQGPTELADSRDASEPLSSGDRADGRDPIALLVAVPSQAPIGSEFSVRLGVPAGNDAAVARMMLAYDPKLIRPVDAAMASNGRLSLELQGPGVVGAAAPPPTDIRFRVVATKPVATRLRIENPSATDLNGNALPLTARRIHSLAIVSAQQTH